MSDDMRFDYTEWKAKQRQLELKGLLYIIVALCGFAVGVWL